MATSRLGGGVARRLGVSGKCTRQGGIISSFFFSLDEFGAQ